MDDKPKISMNRYLGGLGLGSKSWNVRMTEKSKIVL
jgi:hypothetical protein